MYTTAFLLSDLKIVGLFRDILFITSTIGVSVILSVLRQCHFKITKHKRIGIIILCQPTFLCRIVEQIVDLTR